MNDIEAAEIITQVHGVALLKVDAVIVALRWAQSHQLSANIRFIVTKVTHAALKTQCFSGHDEGIGVINADHLRGYGSQLVA